MTAANSLSPRALTIEHGERTLTTARRARNFGKALALASGGRVQPYDLRRTYATWMEAAQIPRSRRRQYMGHSTGDVTELYHEVDRYLTEDAARLEALVRAGEPRSSGFSNRRPGTPMVIAIRR